MRSVPRIRRSSISASGRGRPDPRSRPSIVVSATTVVTPSPLLRDGGELLGLMLGEQRLCQLTEVAIHDVVDLVEREADAVVGDPPLRKIVGADALGAVARADERFARGGFLRLLLARLLVLDARGQDRKRLLLVLVLRARVLTFHHDARWEMRDPDRRVGLVDVLAARSGGAESVDAHISRIQHYVADRVGLGQDRHRAGRGVNAALRLRFRDALDAMASGLELEFRVSTVPDDACDDFLVFPDVARRLGYHFHLPALALRVAGVHPIQIAREECRLVSAGPGADFEEDVAFVVRVLGRKHFLQLRLEGGQPLAPRLDLALGVTPHFGIGKEVLRLRYVLLGIAVLVEQRDDRLQLGVLPRQLAILFQVVRGIFGGEQPVELAQPLTLLIELGRNAGLHRLAKGARVQSRARSRYKRATSALSDWSPSLL